MVPASLRRALAALLVAAALPALSTGRAQAQADDWSIKRDPFDPGVVARLKGLLARNPNDADALAKLLGLYRRYRTVDLLRGEYEAALGKKPGDWATLVVLGRLALAAGDRATALTRFEAAHQAKADPTVAGELGALYRAAGQLDPARAALTRAAAEDAPRAVRQKALRALVDLALAAKDIDGARALFERTIALDPGNVALRLELGDSLAQAGRHDDAIATYQDALGRLGTDPARRVEVMARIGAAQEGKGNDDEAIATYQGAIRLVPRGYYLEVELTARIVDIHRRRQTLPTLVATLEKQWPAGSRGHFEWNTLAHLYEETGQQDAAVAAYGKAVAKAPYELETQRRLIQLLESIGRDREAIAQYEVVAREAPGEASFQLELAERYRRTGAVARAKELLKRMEARFGGDAGVQSAIADLYLRWGEDDLALAALARVARLDPDDPANLITLGEQYFQRGQKDQALATWRRIANAHTPAAHAKLGDVLAEHDDPDGGLAQYARALELGPDLPELYRGRAQIHERRRSFALAIADWEKALSLWTKPSDRSARKEARRRIVAMLPHWDGGRHREVYRSRWRAAFAATPPDLEAGYFLVELYRKDGSRGTGGELRATLERILAVAPEDQDAMLDLVGVLEDQQQWDAAVALLLKLATIAPAREREVFGLIAEVKTKAHLDAEAIEWSQKALAKAPNDPVAYTRLAERYVDMQRPDDAAAAYTRVLELAPRDFSAYFALATIQRQRGRNGEASELYRRVLRQAQSDDELDRAGREAIDLEELAGTLGELEKVVAPLSTILSHKPIYRTILVNLYGRYVPRLVRRARRGAPEVRAAARAELERLGKGGMKPLLDALADEKDEVHRRIAVDSLGYLGNRAAVAPLIRLAREPMTTGTAPAPAGTVRGTADVELRVAALVAAGQLGDPRAVAQVLPLVDHAEVSLREAAVYALARTRDRAAIAPLTTALADHRPSVAALACLGLGGIADRAATTTAVNRLADRNAPDLVRAACAVGLAEAGPAARPALAAAATDNAGETQRLAAWALGVGGEPASRGPLLEAWIARAGDDRSTLAWSLARTAGAPPAPRVDAGEYPRVAGKLHLARMLRDLPGDLPEAPLSADLLVGHEATVAAAVGRALAGHRDAALAVLSDLDARADGLGLGAITAGTVSPAAEAALVTVGRAISAAVRARIADDDPKVAARALSVMAKLGGADALTTVTAALDAPRRPVRAAALAAVATLERRGQGSPALRDALLARLRAPAWEDRLDAAVAIVGLGRAAVPSLVAALGDPSGWVRVAAADALAAAADPTALEPLLTASRDEQAPVRAAVARALRRYTAPQAAARLAELAADPEPEVRAAATP